MTVLALSVLTEEITAKLIRKGKKPRQVRGGVENHTK